MKSSLSLKFSNEFKKFMETFPKEFRKQIISQDFLRYLHKNNIKIIQVKDYENFVKIED